MRGIKLDGNSIRASIEGSNELVDRIPTLTRIHIHYTLDIPSDCRETVDRALERHVTKCPTAVSLRGAVDITWSADITETVGEASDGGSGDTDGGAIG